MLSFVELLLLQTMSVQEVSSILLQASTYRNHKFTSDNLIECRFMFIMVRVLVCVGVLFSPAISFSIFHYIVLKLLHAKIPFKNIVFYLRPLNVHLTWIEIKIHLGFAAVTAYKQCIFDKLLCVCVGVCVSSIFLVSAPCLIAMIALFCNCSQFIKENEKGQLKFTLWLCNISWFC